MSNKNNALPLNAGQIAKGRKSEAYNFSSADQVNAKAQKPNTNGVSLSTDNAQEQFVIGLPDGAANVAALPLDQDPPKQVRFGEGDGGGGDDGGGGGGGGNFISVSGFDQTGPGVWLDTNQDGDFNDGESQLYFDDSGKLYSDAAKTKALNYTNGAWTVAIWDVLGPVVDLNGFDDDDIVVINAAKRSAIFTSEIFNDFGFGPNTTVNFFGPLMGTNFSYTIGKNTANLLSVGRYKYTSENQALVGLANPDGFGYNMLWLKAATKNFNYAGNYSANNIYWGLGTNVQVDLSTIQTNPSNFNIFVTRPGTLQLGTLAKNYGNAQLNFVMPTDFIAWPLA